MHQRVKAVYREGAFVLREPCNIPEDSEVELVVDAPLILSPEITDPIERARILSRLTERMQHNTLPSDAPHLTRDVLHERA